MVSLMLLKQHQNLSDEWGVEVWTQNTSQGGKEASFFLSAKCTQICVQNSVVLGSFRQV